MARERCGGKSPGREADDSQSRTVCRRCAASLLALVLILFVHEGASGQFRGRGGRLGGPRAGFGGPQTLLLNPDVQRELKLSEEQREKLNELARGIRPDFSAMMPLFQQLRAAQDDAERQRIRAQLEALQREQQAKIRQTLFERLKEVLSDEQLARFRQIELQSRGARALLDEDVARELKLTDQQRQQIEAIREEIGRQRDALRDKVRSGEIDAEEAREQIERLQREQDERILRILQPSQREAWQKRLGPPLAANGQDDAATARPPDSGSGSAEPSKVAPLTDPEAAVAQRVDAAGQPIPESTVAEFRIVKSGSQADATDVGTRSKQPAGTGPGKQSPGETTGESDDSGEKRVIFNFQHAPWADVLKLFADLAGLTLDLNQVPPGTFSFHSNKSYTITEALDVLNGYLLQKGYVLVRRDEFLVVVNLDQGVPPNLVPTVSIDELPKRGRNELMTIIIPLEGVDAVETANEIQNLLGPQGKVVPVSKTNQLVVTDIGANLQKIYQLLSSRSQVDSTVVFRAFDVQHIPVADAERLIRQLFGLQVGVANVSEATRASRDPRSYYRRESSPPPQQAQSAELTGPVQLAADERTNRLLVTAKLADLRIIEETLKSIDVDVPGGRRTRRTGPYLEVYQLESADALEVSKTLTVLFPGVVVNEDGRAKRLHIYADEETQRQVAEVIRRLDGAGGGMAVEVIPLRRMDPLTAASTLQSLFAAEGQDAPTIQPHPTGTALIVRGTAEQVQQIRILMAQMDPQDGDRLLGRGRVRSVPLGGRDARQVLQLMEQVWRASQPNPIRVVVPSDSGPVRDRRIPSLPPRPRGDDRAGEGTPSTGIVPDRRSDAAGDTDAPANSIPAGGTLVPAAGGSSARHFARTTASAEQRADRPAVNRVRNDASIPSRSRSGNAASSPGNATPRVRLVAQKQVPAPAAAGTTRTAGGRAPSSSDDGTPGGDRSEAGQASEKPAPPIVVTPTDSGLIIASDDEQALDRFEAMLRDMSMALPAKTGWTVFYLRSADATEAAAMLERLIPDANVATPSTQSSGGLFGGLGAGLANFGRNLLDATGLNNLGGNALQLRIIPEPRSNALFVSGPPEQVREVEELLKVIDASELPEQLRVRTPRMIAVEHADVEQVAEILRDVFREEMSSGRSNDQGRGGNPFAALFGGGRGGSNQRRSQVRLTIGVDTRTNHLVVSADEQLFRQVEALVRALDQAAAESQQTVRIVQLKNSNSAVLQQALMSLMPKVNVRSSGGERSASRSPSTGAPSPSSQSGGAAQGPPPDAIRRFFEQRIRERIMQGLGGGGGPPGAGGSRSGSGPPGGSGRPGGFFGRPGGGGPPGGGRFGRPGGR